MISIMTLSTELSRILGLSKKEVRIIECLSESPKLTSYIGATTKIPRATLDRLLIKLHRRGLVAKHKYSHRRGGWVSARFSQHFEDKRESSSAFPIKNFVGFEEMKQAEYDFMNQYKNIKCYGIQSTRAWNAWHEKLPKDIAAELNGLLVKKNILMDVIITKNVDKELLKVAYKDRPSLAKTIPEEFLPTAFDIEVTSKEVFIMNWEKERGLSIQDEEIALLFKKLIEYIKESSEYYNIHKVLEK